MTDNYDKAEAERIARDLLRTLRDHHAGGVLSMDIPTSGIARALADHLNETPFLTPDDRGSHPVNAHQLDEIRARSQALTDAIKAATAHPEPLDYFGDPGQRSKVHDAISAAYAPAVRSLAADLAATITAALTAEPEGTET